MALLKAKNTEPPEGWAYLQLETKTWIRGDFLEEVVSRLIEHRTYKGLGPTDRESVSKDIQRQICSGLTEQNCRAEPGETYRPFKDQSATLSLSKVVAFSQAMIEQVKSGQGYVSKEESFRRAEICRGCKFNKLASACSCSPFFKLVDALTPANRREPDLKVCTICGCSLQIKVLLQDSAIRQSTENTVIHFPDYCWQKSIADGQEKEKPV